MGLGSISKMKERPFMFFTDLKQMGPMFIAAVLSSCTSAECVVSYKILIRI